MKTIEIKVPLKGISQGKVKPTLESSGYVGESCKAATELYERALGSQVEETIKPEMYQTEQGVERIQEGG